MKRIEGPRLETNRQRDTVIGPVTFTKLRSAYRDARAASRREPDEAIPMKIITLVKAGSQPTLAVPQNERGWMELRYRVPFKRGQDALTLNACEQSDSPEVQARECGWEPYNGCRWDVTQFNGGFVVDFDRAPRKGRCARLEIWTPDRQRPATGNLFARRGC